MPGFTYKSYSFTDKDPIIDQIRTVVNDSHTSHKKIQEISGVTTTTLHAWFAGKTKRPQAATINAVLRALGYKLGVVPLEQFQIVPDTPSETFQAKPGKSLRHVIKMAKYRKKA